MEQPEPPRPITVGISINLATPGVVEIVFDDAKRSTLPIRMNGVINRLCKQPDAVELGAWLAFFEDGAAQIKAAQRASRSEGTDRHPQGSVTSAREFVDSVAALA